MTVHVLPCQRCGRATAGRISKRPACVECTILGSQVGGLLLSILAPRLLYPPGTVAPDGTLDDYGRRWAWLRSA